MATADFRNRETTAAQPLDLASAAWQTLKLAGSLKITVGLFAVSLVMVLVGTLAQDELNMLAVKNRYFVTWFAWLYIDDFFPQAFFAHSTKIGVDFPILGSVEGARLPFIGGKMVGLLLFLNLVAAKVTRFKIHGKGTKLVAGSALIALGLFITAIIVFAGHSGEGLQGDAPFTPNQLWAGTLAGFTVLGLALAMVGFQNSRVITRTLALVGAAILGSMVAYWLISGTRIDDSGLRIVWQLVKGLGAGAFLLAGAMLVFGKQGGNVVLHFGVGLLMVGQFVFGDRQLEQRLSLVEGESSNTLINLDQVELAFIKSEEGTDLVTAIPMSMIADRAERESKIIDGDLPFDVKVKAYYPNSNLVAPDEATNPADTGIGLREMATARPTAGGTDGEVNIPSAYIELFQKNTDQSLGTFLTSLWISDREALFPASRSPDVFDTVTAGDQTYQLGLRFHREVKPYWVQLQDVQRINYSGSDTPRDYSSYIRIVDPETGNDRRERIWMNNPLRYRGETFYQSSYQPLPNGKELTGIQVVKNSGWLIPYVACSVTALGMLAHFLGTLIRFVSRHEREVRSSLAKDQGSADGSPVGKRGPLTPELPPPAAPASSSPSPPSSDTGQEPKGGSPGFLTRHCPTIIAGSAAALLAMIWLVPWQAVTYQLRPGNRLQEFDFQTAGKIPVQVGGRIMPLDAYARQTLKAMSNRESLKLDETSPGDIASRCDGKKLSAIQWLMEIATDSEDLRDLPMFRIDSEAVRSELDLERRKSKLYSLDDISQNWEAVSRQVDAARAKDIKQRDFKELKLIELDNRTRQYTLARASFGLPIPDPISAAEFKRLFPGRDESDRQLFALDQLQRKLAALSKMQAPAVVGPTQSVASAAVDPPEWSPFSVAFFDYLTSVARGTESEAPPGINSFGDMIKAYGVQERDPGAFNEAVDEHLDAITQYPIVGYRPGRVSLERWMQSNDPTYVALYIYLIGLVPGLLGLLVNSAKTRKAVLAIVIVAFLVHTVAILCRMYVTGRAPVINLYSSAVFIGWAAVLFGIVVEFIFRYGIGNLVAAFFGVASLLVAYGLSFTTGDTMPVLQAVLDTQFWLATHVISVTLGYVATMLAGFMGIGYLCVNWFGGSKDIRHTLYRCIYGAACFGILFSFVGTVLGGLWADDSWGRFWGWDPKENGALLIVIWNALMLHARWDGMIGPRGFASLAVGGNIVTAWSWFGTNELGIGLHSYGFTEGVLMWLAIFVVSQLFFIVADLGVGTVKRIMA